MSTAQIHLEDGGVIAINGKASRGARDKNESARTRMMVLAYASQLCFALATVTADRGTEPDAAIEALGLTALKGKVETGDAALQALWQTMNGCGFSQVLMQDLKRFNGGLFKDSEALPLDNLQLGLSIEATERITAVGPYAPEHLIIARSSSYNVTSRGNRHEITDHLHCHRSSDCTPAHR
ncbi:hypothetical protein [Loktanella sp. SALINAS62]|uniref:hypothetical protein n=1 Tax=Loktanella sp. SALINAS62 TaxID=2706124 RepID=UPI002013ABB5|nr:hypothetical protein [Loktanella sp. SALINAS62]